MRAVLEFGGVDAPALQDACQHSRQLAAGSKRGFQFANSKSYTGRFRLFKPTFGDNKPCLLRNNLNCAFRLQIEILASC